jgi:hypothetical protein
MPNRSDWLTLDDAALLDQCCVDTYRASGPGGQKRNKTSSAVRLRHEPSGLVAQSEESRSQHENKARALRRLRATFALELRESIDRDQPPPEALSRYREPGGRLRVSARNEDFWPVMAVVLDALHAFGGELRRAAAWLGMSTGQLTPLLAGNDKVWAQANRIRQAAGLKSMSR